VRNTNNTNNGGFSLIEISTVLIIMGLLVVGIIEGVKLVISSRVVGVTRELVRYTSATEIFIEKYNEFPGVMSNPKKHWGDKAHTSIITNTERINMSGEPTNVESLNFFNHLSLSGLLDDEFYKGSDADLNNKFEITRELYPFSKSVKRNFFYVRSDSIGESYNGTNRIAIGNIKSEDGTDADFLNMIDIKIDDGLPLSGLISIIPTTIDK
jgi:prepilin-type N-terminal cleavage/methylation domain-containing protein